MSSIRWERLVQGIQLFEKYKILLAEAKNAGNEARVAELEELLRSVDIKKISTDSEAVVSGFGNALNAM